MMMTKNKPKFLAILGYPLAHSLSPVMQQAALNYKKIPWYYIPLEVSPAHLSEALLGLRALENFAGANVTIPHKEAVIPFLDSLSEEARATGAVNTIVVESRGTRDWKGYNTDIQGFLEPLRRRRFRLRGKNTVIWGAGGAARAVLYALSREGATEITILCRQPAKGREMAGKILEVMNGRGGSRTAPTVEIYTFENPEARRKIAAAHLLVNATPVGLGIPERRGGVTPPLPIPPYYINAKTLVYDLIYNPPLTPLLKIAREKGAKIINGQEMLVAQGAAAFELWTKRAAPKKIIRQTLNNALKPKKK